MNQHPALHERAQAQLTNEWQAFSELDKRAGVGWLAFDDLAQQGKAECRIEQIMLDGRPYGSLHFYRLAPA